MSQAPQSSDRQKVIAVISKPDRPELGEVLPQLEKWLLERNYSVVMDEESAAYFPASTVIPRGQLAERAPDLAP